ncbi:SpoIIE family protein phosphatase [Candidatus Magnetaquicoccus inordinatus]|uniref:SpoIIE family protein phosphatase n=1 Tax=Candidatus Magnetaquicoccus inordinatus TaxID=2496818 RepID=UPI002A4E2C01|nr:SpoIIE family protein phosphatase [Candidatus Magnetaquicoccus inordinatus]
MMKQDSNERLPLILAVDDLPDNINILKSVLGSGYALRPAISGKAALRAVLVEPLPDLILLDVMMPEMDGYTVCRQLKEDVRTCDIPVIFVTGRSQESDEIQGLELGAVDYITKPFAPAIVLARVRTHLALRAAQRKLDEHNHRLLEERKVIESIVLKMRTADPFDQEAVQNLVAPVEVTAGDMQFSTRTSDGRQLVLLGDFTGHGLTAAVGGPLVSYIFHRLARQGSSGQEILAEINSQLKMRLPTGMFFALILLEISHDRRQALLWNAALPPAICIRDSTIIARYASGLLAMGVLQSQDLQGGAMQLTLQAGDRLYFFTDGIVEAHNAQGELFGLARLETFLQQLAQGERQLADLTDVLEEYTGCRENDDDVTLMEICI